MEKFIEEKIKSIYGKDYSLVSMERLLGGAQKHTYLARCTNGFSFVIYQWSEEKTYFNYDDETEIFRSSSATLFELNNKMMLENGALTPRLYFMDRSRSEQEYDYAFVEYIEGVDMDYIIAKEADRLPKVVDSLTKSIHNLHQIKSKTVGQLDRMQDATFDVLQWTLDNLAEDYEYLMNHDKAYEKIYLVVKQQASQLVKKLSKRGEYTFIHGELGPNHVIVDQDNNAYLIDIEGAKYCDVEEEKSFLNIRFPNVLKEVSNQVDTDRMLLYHIGHCFGNLRGAIELRQKGYEDVEDLEGMIHFFHGELEAIASKGERGVR